MKRKRIIVNDRMQQGGCMKGDPECRRRQRQALLHWGYDSRAM